MNRILAVFFALFAATQLQAAVVNIVATESGGNVIMTGSGSVDLGTLAPFVQNTNYPNNFALENFTDGIDHGLADTYLLPSGTHTRLGSIDFFPTSSGDVFGYQAGTNLSPVIIVNAGYVSGQQIDFTWTVAGTSIAALGLNFGTVFTYDGGTVTLSRATPVPLPASGVLLAAPLVLLALRRRRKV